MKSKTPNLDIILARQVAKGVRGTLKPTTVGFHPQLAWEMSNRLTQVELLRSLDQFLYHP